MASRLSDALNTHMKPRVIGLLMSEADVQNKCAEWAFEDMKNLELLCEHFQIEDGPHRYINLALALAREVVPCFRIKAKEGRTRKWDDYALGILAVELERIVATGTTVNAASKILATKKPWSTFVESWDAGNNHFGAAPADALITAYKAAKMRKHTSVARDAFKYHEMNASIQEWDDEVLRLKGNN